MNGLTGREKMITDEAEIVRILDESKIVHVGMVDGDEAYVVPMNYGYTLEDGKLTIWLHGALRGKKLDIIRKNPKVFVEMECSLRPFDGDIACRYGLSYSSLMGRGTAEIVEDVEQKKLGLKALMKAQTGMDFEFEDKMTTIVSVIKIECTEFTAKHRPMPKN
ncbi:MAG: pyridoxamine 5'-phosphate oxidase family protein [Clostridia bacterium]|nr:pyridoxamine 5'-phosphate oxidase family protein [Clostridia bacterium]